MILTDFILNSDYPNDSIIWSWEGSNTGSVDIAHGLSYAPLVFGIWSYDSDFRSSNLINENRTDIQVEVWSDDTRVHISRSWDTSTKTYIRLYGFQQSNRDFDTSPTIALAGETFLNTSYNYAKLVSLGYVSNVSSYTVNHNLGYIPKAMVWMYDISGWRLMNGVYTLNSVRHMATVSNTSLVMSGSSRSWAWRIYG